MTSNFTTQLHEIKKEQSMTQAELSNVLFDVPLRTLQSWLHGEKLPPKYVQELVLFKLANHQNTVV